IAEAFPVLRRLPWEGRWYAVSLDQAYQLFIALNLLLLGVETSLAHVSNGTLLPGEWVPMVFGPIAATLVVIGHFARIRRRRWASPLLAFVLILSIVVGVAGTYLHLDRSMRLTAPAGMRFGLRQLVWGLPLLAPPSFALIGVLGLVTLTDLDTQTKRRAYMLLTSLGILIAAVSSTIDHLRTGFENPWLWIPVITGIFGTIAALTAGSLKDLHRGDIIIYTLTMIVLVLVGPMGLVLHLLYDLGPGRSLIVERLLRQAPILAPMVFANFGLMGPIAVLGENE
ncbi:MAG: hypothetical protein JXC32_18905, partial [Anaerolineae bacterium]|nr:hypothetical protein [Anaerolineae bacterium]